jgi:hypothetical protein
VIDYSSPPAGQRPPGRRNTPGQRPSRWAAIGFVAVLSVATALVTGHVLSSRSAPPRPAGPGLVSVTAQPLRLGACIDPTRSIEQSFAPAIRRDLAAAMSRLAPPTGSPLTGTGTAPRPAVSLLVREVDTTSFSSDPGPYALHAAVPGVPGLNHRRPVPSDRNYTKGLAAWSHEAQVITADRKVAAAASARTAEQIAALPLDHNPTNDSAITACVSALLVNVPPGGRHSYLLASDLEENVAPQLDGSFRGAPLLIVQTCDSGDVSTCRGLLRRFKALMHRLHAGHMTVVRPEAAGPYITHWIRTGEVTP